MYELNGCVCFCFKLRVGVKMSGPMSDRCRDRDLEGSRRLRLILDFLPPPSTLLDSALSAEEEVVSGLVGVSEAEAMDVGCCCCPMCQASLDSCVEVRGPRRWWVREPLLLCDADIGL